MIGQIAEPRGRWVQALVISLALHGVAAAAILDVLPSFPQRTDQPALPEIAILSLPVDQGTANAVALDQPQQVGPDSADGALAEQVTPAAPEGIAPVQPPVLTPSEDMLAATVAPPGETLGAAPALEGGQAVDLAALPPGGVAASPGDGPAAAGSQAQSAAISDLVMQLRGRVAQPCLAALPQTIGGDEVMLTVLGAVDRDIAALFRDVAGSVEVPMTERSVLLDARQCPAVDFIRASASYPALQLALRLAASEVNSGDRLIGQIDGGRGNQVALLLIDDNGVVQDLGRFTQTTGEAVRLDVPVHRVGGDRDTSQLLLAIALPERPASVTQLDGRAASDFFPALTGTGGALIGAAPVYVRAER